MKKPWILCCVLTVLIVGNCAYYNIFFNAKRYYSKGYEATQKNRTDNLTSAETTNYKKAVEKSAKLIQEYPDSKWVDDAIMLMGKSYYYQKSYLQAERKFHELITHYPESEFLLEARLWQAKTKVALEEFREAEVQFAQLLESDLPQKLRGEASLYLGELYEEQEYYDRAVEAYLAAVENGMKEVRAEAMFSAAACYDSLQNYEAAAEAYNRVLDYSPGQELKFDTRMKYAEMRKEIGKYDEAIHDFEVLLNDQRFNHMKPRIRLQIADCLARKGDINGAIIAYEDIAEDEDLGKTSFAARAYYELGVLYEQQQRDYGRAYDHYKKVQGAASRVAIADSAEMKARDVERLKALQEVIRMGKKGETGALELQQEETDEDTINADILFTRLDTTSGDSAKLTMITELLGPSFTDSLLEERGLTEEQKRMPAWRLRVEEREARGGVDWLAWLDNDIMPSEQELQEEVPYVERYRLKEEKTDILNSEALRVFQVEELDKNLIFLGELYWFRFHLPDSAANQYRYIIHHMPESGYRPKAMYNYAYLLGNQFNQPGASDSVYQALIDTYPHTAYAVRARRWLGLPEAKVFSDSIEQQFHRAENLLLASNDPMAAYRIYERIQENYPESRWAPKAFYSMGWIHEHSLNEPERALTLYDSLIARYPDTEYALKVKPKIEAVRNEAKRIEMEKQQAEAAAADSTGQAGTMSESGQAPVDSTVSKPSTAPESGPSQIEPNRLKDPLLEESRERRSPRDMNRILEDLEKAPSGPADSTGRPLRPLKEPSVPEGALSGPDPDVSTDAEKESDDSQS